MNGESFKQLRMRAGMTQSAAADALGVSSLAVAEWEKAGSEKIFSAMEVKPIRDMVISGIIDEKLQQMAEEVFAQIPCELIAIWLVHQSDCILRPAAVRREPLGRAAGGGVVGPSPLCVSLLSTDSLTTYPLRTGETLNLAGGDILYHPAKKYKTLAASHFAGGQCESLLHVPAFLHDENGLVPVLLITLENKLQNGNVIMAGGPDVRGRQIFDRQETIAAQKLATEFMDRLVDDRRLLDIF